MKSIHSSVPVWEVACNVDEVHELLCACDAFTATPEAPAPVRNIKTTERRVSAGCVHLLRLCGEAVAMFTLTWEPPFSDDAAIFPPARKAAYLGRLAVRPDCLAKGSIIGAQCIRKAVELATTGGADVLRSEANPDLVKVRSMLTLFGFAEYESNQAADSSRRVYLQKDLALAQR